MVGIVLLNYKNPEMTIKCLNSLLNLEYADWEVVVVDNASRDGSVEKIRAAYPSVTVIESESNVGYSKGNRIGYEYFLEKRVGYLWLLNNDTEVDPASLGSMLEVMTSGPRIGAVGCRIEDVTLKGKILTFGGGKISFWLGRSWHVIHPDRLDSLDFLTGASLLVPMKVFEEIGFVDDGYFLYYEDTDFSFELRKHDFRLMVASNAIVYHNESSTIGRRSIKQCYYINRSFVRFCYRHARYPLIPILIGTSLRVGKRVVLGPWNEISIVLKGVRDGWLLRRREMGEWMG
jgi:hypothetical protein